MHVPPAASTSRIRQFTSLWFVLHHKLNFMVLAGAAHQFGGHYPVKVPIHAQTCEASPSFFSAPPQDLGSLWPSLTISRGPLQARWSPKWPLLSWAANQNLLSSAELAGLPRRGNEWSEIFLFLLAQYVRFGPCHPCSQASTRTLGLFLCILRGSIHLSLSWSKAMHVLSSAEMGGCQDFALLLFWQEPSGVHLLAVADPWGQACHHSHLPPCLPHCCQIFFPQAINRPLVRYSNILATDKLVR
jgi:hypothetical protein